MLGNLGDGAVVSHHEAVPSPLLAQHVVDEPFVGRSGNVVHDVERGHHRTCTCLGGCLVGREELVVHPDVTHIHRVIIASGLCPTVEGIVLHAGHHILRTVVALIAFHQRLSDVTAQERILATALGDAPPAGIERNIHHRAVGPADTVGRSLLGGNPRSLLNGLQIPTARHPQGDWKDGLVAVNHIHAYKYGNAQTAPLGSILQLSDTFHACLVQHRSQFPLLYQCQQRTVLQLPRRGRGAWQEVHLSEFLLDGHLGHQPVDKRIHFLVLRLSALLVLCQDVLSCQEHQHSHNESF